MPGSRYGLPRRLTAILALAAAFVYAFALRAQSQELFWHQNYGDALEEARKTGKPIFLEYRCSP